MISKSEIKFIKSLNQKKYRQKEDCFIVEGIKGIEEFLQSDFKLEKIFSLSDDFNIPNHSVQIISHKELKKISNLVSPNQGLAVFKIPKKKPIDEKGLIVALDNVRDPGNLGTIIRLCDWFGITQILCRTQTVDCYNPKVVQASMGSLTRVFVHYVDLNKFLKTSKLPKLGTFLEGENIYQTILPEEGIVILGNEANGISNDVELLVEKKITIPQFSHQLQTESLNVATATGIILSEFLRRSH